MDYQIIVIEDDPASQELYVRNLQKISTQVIAFGNGLEALHHLETMQDTPPHLILLDVNLPGMSGVELLKHIRHRLNMTDTKVVMLTANLIALQNPLMKLADATLQKPVKNRGLREFCQNLLMKHETME